MEQFFYIGGYSVESVLSFCFYFPLNINFGYTLEPHHQGDFNE